MPIAKVYVVPGNALTTDQRREIAKGIHDAINRVERRPPESLTYVLFNDVAVDHWGVSGSLDRLRT
jgi:phenylpyruvate tautomerase PptA (4-oxalocrotonate tautomerase family)